MRFRALSLFLSVFAVFAVASCTEQLEGGGACPVLCPQESAPLKDTIIDAITFDSSVAGFPELGYESSLILAKRADTLDTRVIVRFDSLPTSYTFGADDSTIKRIDSAFVRAILPDTSFKFASTGAIEVYDVTDATNDTAVAALGAQFTAGNLIGSLPYAFDESPDTLTILLDTARVRSRIQNGQRLRVGFRMRTTGSDQLRLIGQAGGEGITLSLYPKRESETVVIRKPAKSLTPTDPEYLRAAIADFTIAVVGDLPPANVLRVGGIPGRRVLFKFNIPPHIVDSSVVVRATLFLTQTRARVSESGKDATVQIVPIVVGSAVTLPHDVLEFAGSASSFFVDSLQVLPVDSARRAFEVVTLVRAWKGQDTLTTPRRAALILASEGARTTAVDFFSSKAPAAVRPQLRITFVTRVSAGRP